MKNPKIGEDQSSDSHQFRPHCLFSVAKSLVKKMIQFLGKNIVGSRIRTYDPRYPRSRITQEPQWLNRDVGTTGIVPPDLHRMGARGNLGSGALNRSAIPTHIVL